MYPINLKFIILILFTINLEAAIFKPQDNDIVLQLTTTEQRQNIRKLQQQFNQNTNNLALALQLAKQYITLSETEGASRYQGYAQAVLKRWWHLQQAPVSVLLIRANLHQKQHKFKRALNDLSQILKAQPRHAKALFKRAFIYRTLGQTDLAIQDCRQLNRLMPSTIVSLCYHSMISLQGKAQQAVQQLKLLITKMKDKPLQQWILTELAEISLRLGRNKQANQYFNQALNINHQDLYLENSYADFLLRQHQPEKVIRLFQQRAKKIPALRLRIALALQQQNQDFSQDSLYLANYFALESARQSSLHALDKARFLLMLKKQPKKAFILAQQNWQIQKEPLDSLIYLQAALASHQKAPLVRQWIIQHQLEDVRIKQLLDHLK